MFSLNDTGSFGNGIIHVVGSVRYRLYIWLIIKLRKSLRLLDTLSQKNYLLQTIIKCNNIFDTNVLSRGYPNKLEIYTNSRGWGAITSTPYSVYRKFQGGGGGSKVNVPSMEVWIFSGTTE